MHWKLGNSSAGKKRNRPNLGSPTGEKNKQDEGALGAAHHGPWPVWWKRPTIEVDKGGAGPDLSFSPFRVFFIEQFSFYPENLVLQETP